MSKFRGEITFVIKKTNELTPDEIDQINKLFNQVFDKFRTREDFEEKFLNNFLKFSFHGLMKSEGIIYGCYHVIPYEFIIFSERKIFGQSVDTTIHPDFRGNIYNLKKLAKIVYDELEKFNIFFVYGLPNKKFYLVKKKVLGWKDLGNLNYYVYPHNLKKFYRKLFPLNVLLNYLLKIIIKIKFKISKENNFLIFKIVNENFNNSRYNNKDYKFHHNKDYKLIYKIVDNKKYNNAKIIYLIDVLPLTEKNLEKSIEEFNKLKIDFDAVVYIGKLKTTPRNFLKIPDFLLKKQTYVSGKILDSSQIKEKIFNISNWNINLSNFDIK